MKFKIIVFLFLRLYLLFFLKILQLKLSMSNKINTQTYMRFHLNQI